MIAVTLVVERVELAVINDVFIEGNLKEQENYDDDN